MSTNVRPRYRAKVEVGVARPKQLPLEGEAPW